MYFNLLPKELLNIILSFLGEKELLELGEDIITSIDYEELIILRNTKIYSNIKKVFDKDLTLKKYIPICWKLIYLDIEGEGLRDYASSTSINIAYSSILYEKYPNCYYFKERLYKLGLRSDYLSFLIYSMLEFLSACKSEKIKELPSTGIPKFGLSELIDLFKTNSDCSISLPLLLIIFLENEYQLADKNTVINLINSRWNEHSIWPFWLGDKIIVYTVTVKELLDLIK